MSMPKSNSSKRKSLEDLRVYAPSRGSLAIETEALPYTRVAEPLPAQPRRRPKLVALPKTEKRTFADVLRENKVLSRAAALVCVFAVALALVFTLMGYNKVSAAQRELNALSKQATELENSVEKTNIDLLFSINAGSAQDAAEAAGMTYPVTGNAGN